MSLTQAQYDEIEREYNRRQFANERNQLSRIDEIYSKIPELKDINEKISSLAISEAKKRLLDNSKSTSSYTESSEQLIKRKKELLTSNGYPEDYISMHYNCSLCKDTGYSETGGKCICRKQAEVRLLYSQSNIENILTHENFMNFNFNYFNSKDIDPDMNKTPLQNIKEVYEICRDFIAEFDSSYSNLYIYGNTGVGKTYLANCIAKELLDSSHSVIYLSSINLFNILADKEFNKVHSTNNEYIAHHLTDCDLLIIDDLGTELVNTFTVSALFQCLNERIIKQKPVIISTNLSLQELQLHYSERILSRLIDKYKMLKIIGNDIRINR